VAGIYYSSAYHRFTRPLRSSKNSSTFPCREGLVSWDTKGFTEAKAARQPNTRTAVAVADTMAKLAGGRWRVRIDRTVKEIGREAAHVGRIARAASEALLDLRFVSLLYPFVKYAAAAQPTRKGNAVPTTPIGPRPSPCETLPIQANRTSMAASPAAKAYPRSVASVSSPELGLMVVKFTEGSSICKCNRCAREELTRFDVVVARTSA